VTKTEVAELKQSRAARRGMRLHQADNAVVPTREKLLGYLLQKLGVGCALPPVSTAKKQLIEVFTCLRDAGWATTTNAPS